VGAKGGDTIIYSDRASSVPGNRGGQIILLVLGTLLAIRYALGVGREIAHNLVTFPASYRSFPVLTLLLSLLALCAYVLFPCVALVMIYIPVRNLFLNRVITGKLLSEIQWHTDDEAIMEIRIGTTKLHVHDRGRIQFQRQHLQVRDLDNLGSILGDESLVGCELRLRVGAFNRVLSVERMGHTTRQS
jgi:hypothetical protein